MAVPFMLLPDSGHNALEEFETEAASVNTIRYFKRSQLRMGLSFQSLIDTGDSGGYLVSLCNFQNQEIQKALFRDQQLIYNPCQSSNDIAQLITNFFLYLFIHFMEGAW